MRNKTDIGTGVVTLGMCLLGVWGLSTIENTASTTDPLGPVAFPAIVLALLGLCGLLQIWQGFHAEILKQYWPAPGIFKKILLFILWFLCYVGLVVFLGGVFADCGIEWLQENMGFGVSTFLYLIGALLIAGRRSPVEIGLVSVLVPAVIILSFSFFFQVTLP